MHSLGYMEQCGNIITALFDTRMISLILGRISTYPIQNTPPSSFNTVGAFDENRSSDAQIEGSVKKKYIIISLNKGEQ